MFYHIHSRKTSQLNAVAFNLKQSCEIGYLNLYNFLLIFKDLIVSKDFFTWSYRGKGYYYYCRNNILKTLIRYPHIYKIRFFKVLLYLSYQLRAHITKCMIILKYKHKKKGTFLIWNGSNFPHNLVIDFAKFNNFKTLFFEIGHFPQKIQVDPEGVNYLASLPKDPDFYLNFKFHESELLPSEIGVRKNKLKDDGRRIKKPSKYIFVVFQVPSDSQILNLSPWVKSMYHLYDIVFEMADKIPDLNFVIKEHPSFKLKIFKKIKPHSRIIFDNWGDTKELIENSDAVLTVNSTAGLEALVLGKKVITLGLANYNLKNLVLNAQNLDELYKVLLKIAEWSFDNTLREQFLKYYYHRYLISGAYASLKDCAVQKIREKSLLADVKP